MKTGGWLYTLYKYMHALSTPAHGYAHGQLQLSVLGAIMKRVELRVTIRVVFLRIIHWLLR